MSSLRLGSKMLLAAALLAPAAATATPLGTVFTYQGQLKQNGDPVTGTADFQFYLYDAATGTGLVAGPLAVNNVTVTEGVFTVQLDFGAAPFIGEQRWLQIAVRSPAGGGSFTPLSPRQLLTAAPFALKTLGVDGYSLDAADGSPTDAVYVDNTGRVGVGTITPGAKLDVRGAGAVNVFAGDRTPFGIAAFETDFNASQTHAYFSEGGNPVFYVAAGGEGYFKGDVAIGDTNTNIARLMVGNWFTDNGYAIYAETFDSDEAAIRAINSVGPSTSAHGIYATSGNGYGAFGESNANDGVHGLAHASNKSGVWGNNDSGGGNGVSGSSIGGYGVAGWSTSGFAGVAGDGGVNGVYGRSSNANASGVFGYNQGSGVGVAGHSDLGRGVVGTTSNANSVGGHFHNYAGGLALWVEGRARVNVLEITGGSDLSEQFEVAASAQPQADDCDVLPGQVVCIDPANPGKLVVSSRAYDRTVAGVVSGAGGVSTGMTMAHEGTVAAGRHPVALTGRVYVWCDATGEAIEPGDLLTTSDTPGHAMKAADPSRSHGAVIGKAMSSLTAGQTGLVLVLVNLQ